MTKLTVSQASQILQLSTPEINYLIREGHIKAEKLDPDKLTSPYIISDREIERYQQAPKSRGRTAKRCEPCNHQPKKLCASCKRFMCIKDYRKTLHGMPSANCKDCENERKKLKR